MNRIFKLHGLVLGLLCWPALVQAQGTAFTYQGQLNDAGSPANGSYDLAFAVFDSDAAGNQIGSALTNTAVAVSNGLFTTALDFGGGVFDGTQRWLEISVSPNGADTFGIVSPRQAITPTPYAIFAGTAAGVTSGSVVTSLNGLKDDVTLAAGNNVTLIPVGNTVTIAAASGGGSSIWSQLNNNAYYNLGNVGIGTSTPQEKLTLAGVTSYNTGLKLTGNASGGTGIALENTSSGGHKFDLLSGGVSDGIGVGAFGIFDETANAYRFSISSGGNVGVGTATPATKLTVRTGNSPFTGYGIEQTDGTVRLSTYIDPGYGAWLGTRTSHGLNFFVGDGLPSLALDVGGNTIITPNGGTGGYGSTTFGTPNGESGMSIKGANRADVRFNGSSIKLVAGFGVGPPPSENGIAVTTAGNVGVGNSAPGDRLVVGGVTAADTKIEVNAGGDTYAALRIKNTAGSWLWQVTPSNDAPGGRLRLTDETTGREWVSINHQGNVSVRTITVRGGADVAEPFALSKSDIAKGSVVVIDESHTGQLKLSDVPYDTHVAGVVSGANGINPGIALQQDGVNDSGQNVALSGRVYVQADATFGAIKPGDLLTTSSTPGHAMKVKSHAKSQGAILGKAMSSLTEGKGMVLVLVTLQ